VTRVLMTADAVGGVWTYALDLARALAVREVQVTLATMGPRPTPEQLAETQAIPGLRVEIGDFALEWQLDGARPPWDDLYAAGVWLLRLESEVAPDVVHLNGYTHGALPFTAPKVLVGHSCLMSWREATGGAIPPLHLASYSRVVRAGLCAADCIVAPTRAMLAALEKHYGSLPHAAVIANGCDAAAFPHPAKQPIVATGGRIWDLAKNVAAVRAIAPALPWPLEVAGAAERTAAPTPHTEILALLSRASIFALPARYEPFGLLPLEAAWSECALVLGDIASLREVWADAAVYVDPGDPAALRAALESLIDDPARLCACARAARRRAELYTAAAMAQRYSALYRSLGESRRCA
jgi:glycogen synthase